MENIFQLNSNTTNETHLPPGFRFHPTDEELITYYLIKKVLDSSFTVKAIAEVDLNKCEPWDLPVCEIFVGEFVITGKAKMGEKEWYFYSLRDRKYPTGLRTNRATGSGYWKATGKDREIYSSKTSALVGMKKTLVFYKGRAPKGGKSNWVMHEYRLEGKLAYHYLSNSSKDEWVISRVFSKSGGTTTTTSSTASSFISIGGFGTSTSVGGGKRKGHGNGGGGGGGSGCIYSPENIGSPISSPTLPPLLDPYIPHAHDRADSCSTYENDNVAVAREQHVPCFSTLTNAGNNNNLLMVNQNHSSSSSGGFGSASSPSLMMMIDQSNNHQHPHVDPPMRTQQQQQLGWSGELSAFQNLRSLQEKLQMPFFYSALAPPHHDHPMSSDPPQQYHHTNEINGGCNPARTSWMFNDHEPDINQHQKVEKQNRMQVGTTEFDCLWT
ncbi:hypothetical protein MKW94_000064 [Papaver nudicaule]|uniref:NAC domain-containing protein n=1 Tax=Papaver nudicaule TaxID=74823 RepID=A0AA41VZ94_PAPNU|nr:hypothetical protein [Papaver nudicaule]